MGLCRHALLPKDFEPCPPRKSGKAFFSSDKCTLQPSNCIWKLSLLVCWKEHYMVKVITPFKLHHLTTNLCLTIHHATQCSIMQHHATPYKITQHHATPYNIMQHHETLCSILQYHEAPCNNIEHHAASNSIPAFKLYRIADTVK